MLWRVLRSRSVRLLVMTAIIGFILPKERRTGTFLGVPYDVRLPTPRRLQERLWNKEDPRIFTPHIFGWGWSVNLYAAGKRLGLWGENS